MTRSKTNVLLAGGLLVLAGMVAYHNSFSVPLLFDDLPAIERNASLRHLGDALSPPLDAAGATGRPLVNLSLAINFALGGLEVRGYHVFNLIVHLLAGLVLFGVVRRTLLLPRIRPAAPEGENGELRSAALPVALGIALLWVVHPLQTESVVCVIQRTELLVGLFYLLTLYCFIRSVGSTTPRRWQAAVIASCLLGVASKEVIATAPLIAFLYDRAFVAGTFREAWRLRGRFHLGLAATWLVLAGLIMTSGHRTGTVGFGFGMTSWEYLLTQCRAIVLYLKLSVWPHPLVLDYGYGKVSGLSAVLPQALLLVALALATVWASWRRFAAGFLGAWVFVILGPSSSVVPLTTQTMAEHRMYLPLAAVMALAVVGLHRGLGRRALAVTLGLAVIFSAATIARNSDYRDTLTIWSDTVAKWPKNARAQTNWGNALARLHHPAEAMPHFAEAILLDATYSEAHHNLGLALLESDRPAEAIRHFIDAARLRPTDSDAQLNWGHALAKLERMPEATEHYAKAAALAPENPEVLAFHGWALLLSARPAEAIPSLEKALRLQPDRSDAHLDLANAYVQSGRFADALPHYDATDRLKPGETGVHYNWGVALMRARRPGEAAAQFDAALKIKPDDPEARAMLARARQESAAGR
ncbi:MAG: tetratricopeptide repeat protein [Opitutus sp.]|nr:tetratricopeptide repeat protein [Opitutus sp.]